MKYNHVLRIRIVLFLAIAGALILVLKLYQVQINQGEVYANRATRQYEQRSSPIFDRGTIFFTSKDGNKQSAATIHEGVGLAINPKEIVDPVAVYDILKAHVAVDKEEFLEKASKKDDPYEEIARRLESETGDIIRALKIPGIIIYRDTWRLYPAERVASHAIGLMGYKRDELGGRYGLESFYDTVLRQKKHAPFFGFFSERSPLGDVVTSLEPSVQNYVETTLAATKEKWSPDEIGAIVMDPMTGSIVAMSALPNFNPNDVSKEKNPRVFSNPLVENAYEMGSIIKPLTMAIALDTGAVTPQTTYNDKGTITVNSKKISNYDGKARGVVPVQEILSQSLNVGIAFIVQKMGFAQIPTYYKKFGFGDITGVDQPNETKGIATNLNSPRDVEHITMGYGQGISMSPISTVRALSVLANGGVLVRPHLAQTIEREDGTTEPVANIQPVQVLKKETTEIVTKMLVEVVDKALRQGEVKMPRYSIAAKTGTAQIADPVQGGYYTDRYLHSFFGYFPAYNPRFIVFLYQVHPKNAAYASETLTYPFIDIAKFLINYYDIPPDR